MEYKVLKKKDILEVVDSYGELIGKEDVPSGGADLESQANNTTDYNAKVFAQPFRYDMLGRFGFTMLPFFEGEEEPEMDDSKIEILNDLAKLMYDKYKETLEYYFRNPNKLKSDFRLHSEVDFDTQPEERKEMDYEWAKKIIALLDSHMNEVLSPEKVDANQKGILAAGGEGLKEEHQSNKTLTFKSRNNDLFYITFIFDEEGRLIKTDNKWSINHPDWFRMIVPKNTIIDFFKKKRPEFYVDDSINEAIVQEKVLTKKDEDELANKSDSKEVREKKIEKIAGLINKLDKKDVDKLINLLERK